MRSQTSSSCRLCPQCSYASRQRPLQAGTQTAHVRITTSKSKSRKNNFKLTLNDVIMSLFMQQENSKPLLFFICNSFKIKLILLNSEKIGVNERFLSFGFDDDSNMEAETCQMEADWCLVGPCWTLNSFLEINLQPSSSDLCGHVPELQLGCFILEHLRWVSTLLLHMSLVQGNSLRQHPGQRARQEAVPADTSSRSNPNQPRGSHYYLTSGPAGRPETDYTLVGQQDLESSH